MDLPDHDNAMKWRKTWNQQPWPVRLLLIALLLIMGGAVAWWFQKSKPGTGDVAIHRSALEGSPVNPQYKAEHDMAVYNIGSIDQLVIGARPEEIESVRQLATASIFKSVSDPIKSKVYGNLERVRKQFAPPLPTITISADKANQNRLKIADEMDDLFRASGFKVKVLVSQLFDPSRKPIKAIFRPKDRQLVEAVLMAFEPMLHANVGVQEVPDRPGDEIVILIMGEPRFTPEGIKVFE